MKVTKKLCLLFAFACFTTAFVSCSPDSTDEEAYNNDNITATTGDQGDKKVDPSDD
ncbi:hypothetical protein GWK08_02470 [Leptobacterium flavescens]|uniref:Uncharacterized protein n=1 Tax=Leptobacterium flavescens TaxID=472055 RepID=A0A6P0UGD0_9FLAO|nr:hypothetical protein [Leptobacterium flavescens]NER12295.1 hypothetical protein [Leptobacterium flavescens]